VQKRPLVVEQERINFEYGMAEPLQGELQYRSQTYCTTMTSNPRPREGWRWIGDFYERETAQSLAVARIRDCASVMQSLLESAEYLGAVVEVADTMTKCLRSGNKILFFGNAAAPRTPALGRRIERTVSQRAKACQDGLDHQYLRPDGHWQRLFF